MTPNFWEYELKALAGTQALKLKSPTVIDDYKNRLQQYAYLEFEDERRANIFGLCVQKNAFPVDEGSKVISPLHYGIRFWSGAYSLNEYESILATRKKVMLFPNHDYNNNFSRGQKSGDDRLTQYMKNAARFAKSDGYDPSEVIICITGGEELYQILAGFYLAERGYIVFPEYDFGVINNFLAMHGVPDIVAVKLGGFQNRLLEEGLLKYGGWFHEIELSLCAGRPLTGQDIARTIADGLSIAIEVEDTVAEASKGYRQVRNYVSTGYFDGGLLVCPKRSSELEEEMVIIGNDGAVDSSSSDKDDFLLMTWNDNGIMQKLRLGSQIQYSEEKRLSSRSSS